MSIIKKPLITIMKPSLSSSKSYMIFKTSSRENFIPICYAAACILTSSINPELSLSKNRNAL